MKIPIKRPGKGKVGELDVTSFAELPTAGDYIYFYETIGVGVMQHRGSGVTHLTRSFDEEGKPKLDGVEVWLPNLLS